MLTGNLSKVHGCRDLKHLPKTLSKPKTGVMNTKFLYIATVLMEIDSHTKFQHALIEDL